MSKFAEDHLVVDCEAIGADPQTCPTLEWSYVRIDFKRFLTQPYTLEELLDLVVKDKMDVRDQMNNYSCSYRQSDLDWWMSKTDMRYILKPTAADLTVQEFLAKFIRYLGPKGPAYWWTRSNTYDPVILQRLAQKAGRGDELGKFLAYYRVRDVRTFIDAKLDFPTQNDFVPLADAEYWRKTFRQHDSRHDVAADALRMQTIVRAENDLEQTAR